MSIIGEAILSTSVEMLVQRLASEAVRLFARQEQNQTDLKKWGRILVTIKAVLDDAEEKQSTDRSVKIWLSDLQNLAFDVEDILDEFETEAFRRKLQLQPVQPSTSNLLKLLPTCCTNLTPQSVKFDSTMESKIKEITERLQDIATQKDLLDLKEISGGKSKKVKQRLPTTSLVNEAQVYGRDKEKEEIVQLLLRDDSSSGKNFSVTPIVGMGGLGKTTLAQLVYNDIRVQQHFDLQAWTCVSDEFDVTRITKSILMSFATRTVDYSDLNLLQEGLRKELLTKKFLFVLDDVWNENYNVWSALSSPFQHAAPGSKIVVTCRNHRVATMMGAGNIPTYHLEKLSNDDCLCVLAQHSLETTDFTSQPSLKEVGEKIVQKCDGLPLAAKALGGLLRGNKDPRYWEGMYNSKIWDLPGERCDILPALRVSYHYLSPRLKQCFAYCSLFPKDYEFREKEIVLLWMAAGFLHQEDNKMIQMEDLGHNIFQELQSRSFFQQSSGDTSLFVIHDLINDLAQWAAGEIYFRMEDSSEGISKYLGHLSFIPRNYDGNKRFEPFYNVNHLRTFLSTMLADSGEMYLAGTVLQMLSKFPRLRVLSLCGYRINKLPKTISVLKHLRHLDLSYTQIKDLPESVTTLYNLYTIQLEGCFRLKKLCTNIENLIKLRHLNNCHSKSLEEMPLGIGKLTSLQTLYIYTVGKDIGSGLQELKSLINLRGTLQILSLQNVKDVDDAKDARLSGKENLKALLLSWYSSSSEPETETRVLDMLKPHRNLNELRIRGYGGNKFPIWIGDSSFSNLVLLKFRDCGLCTSLPSLGQLPSLKHLSIRSMGRVKTVGSEFYGNSCPMPFPSLVYLSFKDMEEWEEWIPRESGKVDEGFPNLRELIVEKCPKLRGTMPKCLPALQRFVIKGCQQLVVSVPSLPPLCRLEVAGCKTVVGRSRIDLSLNSAILKDMSNQVFFSGLSGQELLKLEELGIKNCENLTNLWQSEAGLLQDVSSLHELTISTCPQLLSLVAEQSHGQKQQELSCSLQYLNLIDCDGLVKLPQALLNLNSLKGITIDGCRLLVSFPEVSLPSQLRNFSVQDCPALESLPEAWMYDSNTSLETLSLHSCPSLTYVARIRLPSRLKQLEIIKCCNLRSLIDEDGIHDDSKRYTSLPDTLEDLDLCSCSKLSCLSSTGNLPVALKTLHVYDCPNLESIAETLHNNSYLETITILKTKNLKLLPNGLGKLRHLQKIVIYNCPYLVCLPNCMHNSTSLLDLHVGFCPSIITFPEYGFPTSLRSLEIAELKIFKQLSQWGLDRLTSLKELRISRCPDTMLFPEIGMKLPDSLTQLMISRFPNLERMSSIGGLKSLEFYHCPKLKHFPEEELPTSLLRLDIVDCPFLEKKFRKDGEYWHLTDHIPCVIINHAWVFEGDE